MEGSSRASYTVIFIVGYSSGTMEIISIKDLAVKEVHLYTQEELPYAKEKLPYEKEEFPLQKRMPIC